MDIRRVFEPSTAKRWSLFVSLVVLTLVLAVFSNRPVLAIVNTTASDDTGFGLRLKQSSAFASALKIQFGSNENTKTLTSVTVSFTVANSTTPTWTDAAATSSELLDLATTNGGISLWKETAGGAGFQAASDTQQTLAASPVYGASNTFVITPAVAPTLATDDIYYVVLKSDTAGVTNNNAFTMTIAANGIVTSVSSPTVTAVTTQAVIMDTAAPTVSVSGPASGSTGVPISTFVGVNFNENVAPGTLNPTNVTFTQGGTAVGNSLKAFPIGFNLIPSSAPAYAASSNFAKAAGTTFAFYQMNGTNPVAPQGGAYTAPVAGDIVYFQHDTFPPELGLITNATLTSGTFAVNNFTLFGGQSITKFSAATATGAVTAATALTTGDLLVANVAANPTGNRYAWHIVTTGAAVNNAALRIDGAGAAPGYVAGSNFSQLTPTDTSAVNGTSQVVGSVGGGINFAVGDLVFAKITAGGDNLNTFAWHVVTAAENITTDAAPSTLRLDSAGAAPTFAATSQVSRLATAAQGAVTDTSTALSAGDILFAKTTANAGINGAYDFHLISTGATGTAATALRLDNASGNLTPSTTYTLTIGTGVTDQAGNPLASQQVITFTTGTNTGADTTPPFVQSSIPQPGNQTVPPNGVIKLTFSVAMSTTGGTTGANSVTNPTNVGLFTDVFGEPGTAVTATNSYDSASNTVTITPSAALSLNTSYVARVTAAAQSSTGTPLTQPYFLHFRTAAATDSTAPTVLGVSPANAATGVNRSTAVTIGFSKDMDPATITTSTITLSGGVVGTVSYNPASRSATFSPTSQLAASTAFTITVVSGASGVKDVATNQLAANFTSTFTTDGVTDVTLPKVSFAGADNFGVAITFSEQVKTSGGPAAADNIANYTLESPVGTSISLAGKTVTYDGGTKTARISGLILQNDNTFKALVANLVQDLAGNGMDTTGTPANNSAFGRVQNSTTTGGNLGPGSGTIDPTLQGLNPTNITPQNRAAGATSSYDARFLATTSIPLGGKIVLTFPAGFNVAGAAAVAATASFCNADLNGPGAGTVTIASVVNDSAAGTITITTAGAATGANAFLCMNLSGIGNSTVPNSAGYAVDIKTRDTVANNLAVLETKTSAPFFLGQTGSGTLKVNVFKDANSNGVNDASEGINGATVFLYSPNTGGQEGTTATDVVAGVISFTGLTAGDYMVGLKPNATIDVAFNSAPQPVTVAGSGTTTKNFALSSAAALTISGTITGPAATKIDVFAGSQNGFSKKTLTLTGGADAYSIPVLANSTYTLGVGPSIPETFFTPGAPPPPPPTFTFMPPPNLQVAVGAASVTGQNFVLAATNKTITGLVTDINGTGVSNTGIFCRPVVTSTTGTANGFGTGAMTGTNGTFTINVTADTYLCGVFKPGMPPVPDKQIIVPASGANTPATLTFVLATTTSLTISGTVKDDAGNAIPYSGVGGRKVTSTTNTTAIGGDPANFVGGPTDANGAYTLYVTAGTWVVEAFAPGFGKLGSKTITVTTANVTGQDFSAQTLSIGTITGTASRGGVGQQGVMIRAEGTSGSNMVITATDGTYSLKVPAGTYTVNCFYPGFGESTPLTNVVVTSGATTSGKNCSITSPITITINITDGTSPVTGAFIDVRDSNGRGNGTNVSATSGANAVYTVTVPPGTYTVRAGHPAYGPIGTTASVATTQTITYTATAGKLFAVTGQVISGTSGVASAWIAMFGTPSGQTNIINVGAQTDSGGNFSINVPPGSYKIRADKPGFKASAETAINVTDAATTAGTINLLTAPFTITGAITLNSVGVSNAFVDANDGLGGYAVAQTDASGNYSLAVDNGTWSIRAHSLGYEGGPLSVAVGDSNPTGKNIALAAISGFIVKPERQETVTPTSGGFFTNSDIGANFKINIPANALGTSSNSSTIKSQINTGVPTPPTGTVLSKNAVTITAVDSTGSPIKNLNDSITIVVPYTEADLPTGTNEANLILGVWNDATKAYDTLPTTVDATANTLTATITHFSDVAPIVPASSSSSTPAPTGGGGGGGGGGGSGGGSYSAPASSTTVAQATPSTSPATSTPSSAAPATASGSLVFSSDLSTGSRGDDVTRLQTFLEGQGLLSIPTGINKGYFGALTKTALSNYQKTAGLKASGILDAATRDKLAGKGTETAVAAGASPKLAEFGLKEGQTISASGTSDPDIYIVNAAGFKRLFLNPVIFGFYGHLKGFSAVKGVAANARDAFPTSGLFRNCETNDPKVYGVETTGEDTGVLHWVNTSGAQAVVDDPDFFKKVFCINSNEFNWYRKGSDYTSVNQVPNYSR